MGPFLSGTGINQKVSGGRWIWAVVLFTDDWLASQNHQIHLPAVTFITVIFKVTATCLVSQHWPPHIYSHLFSPPSLFFLSASVFLSHSVAEYLVSHSPVVSTHPPSSFLLLLTTFIWLSLSLSPIPPPPVGTTLILSLCWAGWGEAGSGRCGERQGRQGGERRENKPPHLFHCLKGVFWIPISFALLRWSRNSFCTLSPAVLHWRRNSPFPSRRWMQMKQFRRGMCWSQLHLHGCVLQTAF